ncbi:CoA ester lyase [Pseudonocardia nematodicida]|uniref:CoA ester lyase n=1 Tax=Pseudonocardia nematodicida TaxID=1206997 RepID=A0ABV1K5L2_9PSEU
MNRTGDDTAGPPAGPAVLFCPADRPDRFAKAFEVADAVILDLEDAVRPDRKQVAREALRAGFGTLPAERAVVRVNAPHTAEGRADLELVRSVGVRFVMLPKAEYPADVEQFDPASVIALCETARGVENAPAIAAAGGCVALMWGGEDLTADIGGRSSRDATGRYLPHVSYARARILVAAAAARVVAWDGVYLDIPDRAGLEAECDDAVAMGFAAKVAIHPSHTPVIRRAYRPTDDELARAEELLGAVGASTSGVVTVGGRMVDGPLVAMARAVVAARRSAIPGADHETKERI